MMMRGRNGATMRWIALGMLAFTMFTMSGCTGGPGDTAAAMMITGGHILEFDSKFGAPVRESRNDAGERVCIYQFRDKEDMAVAGTMGRVWWGLYTLGISELFHEEPEEGYPLVRRVFEYSVTFDENDYARSFTPSKKVSAIAYWPTTGEYRVLFPPP